MASWGRNVDMELSGTGSIDANTDIIIGVDTLFTDEVEAGNLIDLDGQGTFVVTNVVDDETLLVDPAATVDAAGQGVFLSEVPKYLTANQAINEATFVTVLEAKDPTNRVDGIKTPGWTLYKEYVTEGGTTRRVVETLVAMKQTSTP